MNQTTKRQILTLMAHYNKPGIQFRRKQIRRLLSIFDDIFQHEPYLGEHLHKVGKRQLIGYFERTRHESDKTRLEKYQILKLFFSSANLKGRVPHPKLSGRHCRK